MKFLAKNDIQPREKEADCIQPYPYAFENINTQTQLRNKHSSFYSWPNSLISFYACLLLVILLHFDLSCIYIHSNIFHMNFSSIYNFLQSRKINRRIHHIRQRQVSAFHSGFYDNLVHNDTSRVPSVNYLSHLYTNGPQLSSVSSLPPPPRFPDCFHDNIP